MGWFPVFADLIEDEKFKNLTAIEKVYFFHLVSRFNRDGKFFQSDMEIAMTLGTSLVTIRRARRKLTKIGLIEVTLGTLTKRNQCLATSYLKVRYATMDEAGHFGQVNRFTFQVMLHLLRGSRFKPHDVLVYVCLSYLFRRFYGKREDRQFFITKSALQTLTGSQGAPVSVAKIYDVFTFSDGRHLFEYEINHQKLIFKDWATCDEKAGQNWQIAEEYLKEIKDLVNQKKQEQQIKLQQKTAKLLETVKLSKKTKCDYPSPLIVFYSSYMKLYDRRPNSRGDEKLLELEKIFGPRVIHQAITWYFSADVDEVPNGSGARTRTLGNFVAHIDEILKLSAKSAFV